MKHFRLIFSLIIISLILLGFYFYKPVEAQGGASLVCSTASPGDIVSIQGTGFTPGAVVQHLRWDGVVMPWSPTGLTVGNDGQFTLWFTASSDTYALHTLVVDDGGGSQGECYLNLTPRHPTPTFTPSPTLTPSPTPTATPGPPPGVTLTPTPVPGPGDYCADISAVFSRSPLVGSMLQVGADVTNTNIDWGNGQVQLGLWQHYGGIESSTGDIVDVPALSSGAGTTLTFSFQENEAGPIWYQLRLIDTGSGMATGCISGWYPVYVRSAEPLPPALLSPANNTWLGARQITLSWAPAEVPDGAGPVDQYEVQLDEVNSSNLLYQAVSSSVTAVGYNLPADYGANRLTWRARARNSAGWGGWSESYYFGVDTAAPAVNVTVSGGTAGDNGWYVSPVTVQVSGTDPAPGSGLTAAFLQPGDTVWQQVVPGANTSVNQEGTINLRGYGYDESLNLSTVAVHSIKIDQSEPEQISAGFSGQPTSSGWYTSAVTLDIGASDSVSGIAEHLARIGGGDWQSGPVTLSTSGEHGIEFTARDRAGNEAALRRTTAKLDLSGPTGSISVSGPLCQACDPATVNVAVEDTESGVGHWTLSVIEIGQVGETILASGSTPDSVTLNGSGFPTGTLTLRLAVEDEAGWLFFDEMDVINGGQQPGPTPTPGTPVPTATLWPTPGSTGTDPFNTPVPGPTSTPNPEDDGGDDGGDDGSPGDDNGGKVVDVGGNYPVGNQVVPVLLPVTGEGEFGYEFVFIFLTVAITLLTSLVFKRRSNRSGQ